MTRAVIQDPTLFSGLVYLSSVTEDQLFSTPEFSARIGGSPHAVFARWPGPADPASLVAGTVASLQQLGGDVQLKIYEDEDHFLLWSRQEDVLNDIARFMRAKRAR